MHRIPYSILAIFVLFFTSGCWDSRDLNERVLVSAIGVDKLPNGKNEFSLQVPIPTKLSGGSSSSGPSSGSGNDAVQIYSQQADNLSDATYQVRNEISGNIFFGYTQVLMLSEEVARDGINELTDALRRSPSIRRQMWPVVIEGKAKDALSVNIKMQQVPAVFVNDMIQNGSEDGQYPDATLNDLLINLSSNNRRNAVLNIVKPLKDGIRWNGLAVFKGGKMVGTLSPDESNILLHIRESRSGRAITTSCGSIKGKFSMEPHEIDHKIIVHKNPVSIEILVSMKGTVLEKNCQIDLLNKDALVKLSKQAEQKYEQEAGRIFDKTQKKWNTDVFLIGKYINSYYPKIYKQVDWSHNYKDIPIKIKYNVDIVNIGIGSR